MMHRSSLTPSRTVVTSFTPRKPSIPQQDGYSIFEEGDWVLCLAAESEAINPPSSDVRTLSCALSNGQVQVYDQQWLHMINSYPAVHGNRVTTDLVYGPQNALISAGQDGTLSVLDLRQGTVAMKASLPQGQEALSVSLGYDGYLAAVGSNKARIHFFDLRSGGNLLGSFVDAHTDEVTLVKFLPNSGLLATAAEDGLACIFDTSQPTEETAIKSVLNIGAPPRKIGFCGKGSSTLYCLTGSETVSLWDWDNAICLQDFGLDFREQLSQTIGNTMSVDFLVDASWDAASQELLLIAGSATGDAALFRMSNGNGNFEPCHSLMNGHRGVVRAWAPLTQSILVTAGEDARLCEWNRTSLQAAMPSNAPSRSCSQTSKRPSPSSGNSPMHRKQHRQTDTPY